MSETLTEADLNAALEVYRMSPSPLFVKGKPLVNHILHLDAPLESDAARLVLDFGQHLDRHYPTIARPIQAELNLTKRQETDACYDSKLQVCLRRRGDGDWWSARQKKWSTQGADLAQTISRVYNHVGLIDAGWWVCAANLKPRQVEHYYRAEDIRLVGEEARVKFYYLLLAAPTREELERMIAYHQAKAA